MTFYERLKELIGLIGIMPPENKEDEKYILELLQVIINDLRAGAQFIPNQLNATKPEYKYPFLADWAKSLETTVATRHFQKIQSNLRIIYAMLRVAEYQYPPELLWHDFYRNSKR